jgi:molybdenum cofactor cytidylyltransferase
MDVTCVILAAGLSRRFGSNKLLERDAYGVMLVERALEACSDFPVVAVTLRETAGVLRDLDVSIVLNPEPDRGMSHSLKLANATIDPTHAIAVLPADLALISPEDVRAIVSGLGAADVAYPVRDGVAGHPVVFGPRARARIPELHDGDTISDLRDAEELSRTVVSYDGSGPFADVDTPADLVDLR